MSDVSATSSKAAWRALGITVVATALTLLVDRWVYLNVQNPSVYDHDWGRLLRVMGFAGFGGHRGGQSAGIRFPGCVFDVEPGG